MSIGALESVIVIDYPVPPPTIFTTKLLYVNYFRMAISTSRMRQSMYFSTRGVLKHAFHNSQFRFRSNDVVFASHLCGFGSVRYQSTRNSKKKGTKMSMEPGLKTPYSADIRWRVVWQHLGMELPFREIARRLNISSSTAYSIWKRFQETGDVKASKQPKREDARKIDLELFIIGKP